MLIYYKGNLFPTRPIKPSDPPFIALCQVGLPE